MKKELLNQKIAGIEAKEIRFARQLNKKPGLAIKAVQAFLEVLKFARDYGYDPKTGKKKKLGFWAFLFNKQMREDAGKIVGKIVNLFDEDLDQVFEG